MSKSDNEMLTAEILAAEPATMTEAWNLVLAIGGKKLVDFYHFIT